MQRLISVPLTGYRFTIQLFCFVFCNDASEYKAGAAAPLGGKKMKPRRDYWFPHLISLFSGYYDTGPRSGEVRRLFDEHNLLSVCARRLIRVPWSILAVVSRRKGLCWVYDIKATGFQIWFWADHSRHLQLGRSAPDIYSSTAFSGYSANLNHLYQACLFSSLFI